MKIKITKASKYLAQGQVVECPKSIGLRFIALGKAVEYKDNQDELEGSGSTQATVLVPEQAEPQTKKETKRSIVEALAMEEEAADINFDPSPTPRRKRKPRKPRSN